MLPVYFSEKTYGILDRTLSKQGDNVEGQLSKTRRSIMQKWEDKLHESGGLICKDS